MKFRTLFLPAVLGVGMLAAQTTTPPARTAPPEHSQRGGRQMMLQKLTSDLNLTPDQQAKAKQIFDQSWQQRKAIAPKLKEERGAILAAIKSDNVTQIDRLIQQNSQLNAQAAEIHAKAMAQFYAILNPQQKAKMDQKLAHFLNPMARARHAGQSQQTSRSRS